MIENLEQIFFEWLDKADADLAFATFAYKETSFFSHVCLLCQQAVEKYLKGLLVAKKVPLRKIHYTATLAEKCSKFNERFLDHIKDCKTLDKYYIPARYPVGIKLNISKTDAGKALEIAREISLLVRESL